MFVRFFILEIDSLDLRLEFGNSRHTITCPPSMLVLASLIFKMKSCAIIGEAGKPLLFSTTESNEEKVQ